MANDRSQRYEDAAALAADLEHPGMRRRLRVIASRESLDLARVEKRHQALSESILHEPDDECSPELELLRKTYAPAFKASFEMAMQSLSLRERSVLAERSGRRRGGAVMKSISGAAALRGSWTDTAGGRCARRARRESWRKGPGLLGNLAPPGINRVVNRFRSSLRHGQGMRTAALPSIVVLIVGAAACKRSARDGDGSAESIARGEENAPYCGNGRIDPDEVCDMAIAQRRDCPDGWGVCQTCVAECSLALVSHEQMVSDEGQSSQALQDFESFRLATESREYDLRRDRALVSRTLTDFDDKGRWRTVSRDIDGDGDIDTAVHFEFDAHGRRTLRYDDETISDTSGKKFGGNTRDSYQLRYDPEGRVVEQVSRVESGGAVTSSSRAVFEYDEEGRLKRVRSNQQSDGSFSREVRLEYDARGYLHRRTTRFDGKQVPSFADEVFELTEFGMPTALDLVVAGKVVARETWTYDRGKLIRRSEDTDMDGRPEVLVEASTTEYERDEKGRISVARTDLDGDARFDREIQYLYDEAQYARWSSTAPTREPLRR